MKRRILLWGSLVVAMVIIGTIMIQIADREEPVQVPETESTETPEVREIFEIRENDWIRGNPDADLIIVKYSDFQCPACRFYASFDNQISSEYADEVLFVRRYFPLRSFQFSRLAAKYAEAAGRQGKFWEMHDLLYINQHVWSGGGAETIFQNFADSLDLDSEQLQTDLLDPAIQERIESDYQDGRTLGIRGVPTIYVRGEQVSLPNSLDAYRSLIESKL